MSKLYDYSFLGYELKFAGYDSYEAFDADAGEPLAALGEAHDNLAYRSTAPKWMEKFAELVEKASGVARGTDAEATEKAKSRAKNPDNVKAVAEKVKSYNARVVALIKTGELTTVTLEDLVKLAQQAADETPISSKPVERTGGGNVNVGNYRRADAILERDADEVEKAVAKCQALLDEPVELDRDPETGKPTRDALAQLISKAMKAL